MADEQFVNEAQSTLASAIDSSQTTITVSNIAPFPVEGDFSIRIDNELMRVTSVSGSNLIVERGSESTTAESHDSGTEIYNILTAESLNNFRRYTNLLDIYANRPVDNRAGRLYFPSNGHTINVNTDSAWKKSGPIYHDIGYTLNILSTSYNQVFDTVTFNDSFCLNKPAEASDNITLRMKFFNFSTTWTIRALLLPNPNFSANGWEMGLALLNSSSESFKTFGFKFGNLLTIGKWDDYFTLNLTSLEIDLDVIRPPHLWLGLEYDGSTLEYQVSSDNVIYQPIYSETLSTFINPDRHGIYINSGNNKANSLRVLSYLEDGT